MPPLPLVLLLLLCVGISCGRQRLLNDEKKGEREVRRLTHAVRRASAESAGTRRSGKGPLGSWEVRGGAEHQRRGGGRGGASAAR
eukprot:scaffold176380_cov28-Tisochrysis_lutea.AAC.5